MAHYLESGSKALIRRATMKAGANSVPAINQRELQRYIVKVQIVNLYPVL